MLIIQTQNLEKHYVEVSSSYDYLFSDYIAATVSVISRQLQFTTDDTILDIGGGTGEISHRLWKLHHLKAPVVCVDPSEAMLEIARKKEGVEAILSSAEEFLEKIEHGRLFSKILICGCYHHFNDFGAVLPGIARALSENGVCLVLGITADSAPHSFIKASYKELNLQQMAKLIESKGLKANTLLETEASKMRKEFCFEFIRKRTVSYWSKFTDAEIETEIEKMEQKYSGQDIIDVEYKMELAIISK